MAWKKILLEGDAATLSDTTPQAVDGSAGAAGTGISASRDDHVHALGPLTATLDFNQQQADGMVLEAVDVPPDSTAEVEGQVYYDSGAADKHIYVWNATEWKKLLLDGDAAELSDSAPQSVGTAGAAGTGTSASRDDHVHDLGTGCIDASDLFTSGVVDATAIATGAVGSDEIDNAATDIAFAQIILTPAATGTGTAEGTLFYDSDDDHLYVYVAA